MKNCQICLRSFALTIFILVMGTGCGPILSTVLIQQAAAELEGAKAAHAEIHAPYEYTGAELYLEKAKEQQGYAEFSPAVDFAYKANKNIRNHDFSVFLVFIYFQSRHHSFALA